MLDGKHERAKDVQWASVHYTRAAAGRRALAERGDEQGPIHATQIPQHMPIYAAGARPGFHGDEGDAKSVLRLVTTGVRGRRGRKGSGYGCRGSGGDSATAADRCKDRLCNANAIQ